MHPSSLENMNACKARYIDRSPMVERAEVTVLDVGGADINGSYRDVFGTAPFKYIAADIAPGPGVSLVMHDPYRIPLEDRSVDIVISGQMLEHCEYFWQTFAEMVRVMKQDGFMFLIAPSAGPEHRYPVDCYRFYPDSYRALARYADCIAIEVRRDEREPWYDIVGVFRHTDAPPSIRADGNGAGLDIPSPVRRFGSPEENVVMGDRPYLEVLHEIHHALRPRLYLEIGVARGASLALAECPAIGVDPLNGVDRPLPPKARVVPLTSDEFFATDVTAEIGGRPDLVFIDGDHRFETVLRDFINVEAAAEPTALVVFDDVLPSHFAQAERDPRTASWMGDVWRIVQALREQRPDLFVALVDTQPGGMMLVYGLDAQSRALVDRYSELVDRARHDRIGPPTEIIQRRNVISGRSPTLGALLATLALIRAETTPRAEAVARLRAVAGQRVERASAAAYDAGVQS